MQISINGEAKELAGQVTLIELLEELSIDPRTVAIELAGDVIPRAAFAETRVVEGSRVEIVRFVQGG